MNYTKPSSYMGLIVQIEKEHIRVDYKTAIQRGRWWAGLNLHIISEILFIVWSRECYT